MKPIDNDTYERVIAGVGLKPRLVRELRPKLARIVDWEDREFVVICDRSGNTGILWVELDGKTYVVPYSLARGIVDKASGRARPVICDLCCTQQLGTAAARISFAVPGRSDASRSLLCCADLGCCEHVRGKTHASLRSKTQLRESISVEGKIARLHKRLGELLDLLGVEPVDRQ